MKAGPRAQESQWERGREEDIKREGKEVEYRGIISREMPRSFVLKKKTKNNKKTQKVSCLLNKSRGKWHLLAGDPINGKQQRPGTQQRLLTSTTAQNVGEMKIYQTTDALGYL